MSRTLVKTDSPGWYVDVTNPDKKIRAKKDDNIFDNLIDAQSAQSVLEKVGGNGGGNGDQAEAPKAKEEKAKTAKSKGAKATKNGDKAAEKPEPQSTVAETGKILVGKTLTIQCEWKLENGKRCPNKRTIKPQDRFQVKFCVEHQGEHRKKLRREKQKARTARRRQEREAAKAKEAKASGAKGKGAKAAKS